MYYIILEYLYIYIHRHIVLYNVQVRDFNSKSDDKIYNVRKSPFAIDRKLTSKRVHVYYVPTLYIDEIFVCV